MNRSRAAATSALMSLACATALAAVPTVPATATLPASEGGLLQALAGMVLVLGLIFLLAWLARRFGLQRLGGASPLKVVTIAPVGTRERVVVVEVAGTWLVLGVTSSQVNILHTLPAQSAAMAAAGPHASPNMPGLFSHKLRDALGIRPPAA